MSYKNLNIWQLSRELVIEIHKMTITKLPKFEIYEEGSQIRRSIRSVKSNIVEGYGRRRYKKDYIKFITYSLSSNDETINHLETLFKTKSFTDLQLYNNFHNRLEILGKKLNLFLQSLERSVNNQKLVTRNQKPETIHA